MDPRMSRPQNLGVALAAGAFALLLLPIAADAARDPMRPPQAETTTRRAAPVEYVPTLTAVMGTPERRIAIVDGRVVRPGDTVAGGAIEAVTERGVRYRRGGTVRELRLASPAAVKKPAAATKEM
jgi:hypothetical protein